MIGSFARLLLDLKKPPSYSSRLLFENTGSTPLYEAMLDGKDVCLHSLPEPLSEHVIAMKVPSTMCVQLDNYAKDNKSRYFFCILVVIGCERHFQGDVCVISFGRPRAQ